MQRDMNKRYRSQNWINQDKVILRNIIRERIDIITNKNTDSITNRKKEKAWDEILDRFNKVCVRAPRTLSQIKAQWGIMKMQSKTREKKKNGMGKSDGDLEPESVDVPVWLPVEVKIETDESDTTYATNQEVAMVSTPHISAISSKDEVKSEKSASQLELKRERLASPVQEETNIAQDPTLGIDSNDRWWCSDSTENAVNNSDVSISAHEGIKKRKQNKSVAAAPAQSLAAEVASVEIECRRELHKMQMKVASLQVANEEHKSRILHLEEVLHSTKIEYYKRKMLFYNRDLQEVEQCE